MKLQRLLVFWILTCSVFLATFGAIIPVKATPDFVTETSSAITIENGYYKAVIDKTTGSFGGIKDFYIKPDTAVDIVASNTNFDVLGGHEIADYNSSTELSQFGGDASNTEICILENTASYVVVYCKFDLENATTSQSKTHEEWKTFYYTQPYYQVSYKATHNSEFIDTYNNEICFLYDNEWVEELIFLNETGQVETVPKPPSSSVTRHWLNPQASMELANSFSWATYHNSTYGAYAGTIITSLQPRFPALTMKYDIHGPFANAYSEYQLTQDSAGGLRYGNETYWGSYINYVSSDYKDIATFAQTLYQTTYTSEIMDTLWCWTDNGISWNRLIGTTMWSFYKVNGASIPYKLMLKNGWEDTTEIAITLAPRFRNTSGAYPLWDYNNHQIYEQCNSTTEANVTYTTQFEHAWRVNMTFQFYNDTEVVIVKTYFRALKNLTSVTRLELVAGDLGDMPPYRNMLNNTMIVQDNETVSNHYYRGFAVVNKTAYDKQTESPNDFFWRLYSATGVNVQEGAEYTMEYWFQPYRKRLTEGLFETSDFLALHESMLKTYRNQWIDLYLVPSPFRVKDYVDEDGVLVYHNYVTDQSEGRLTLIYDGTGTQTYEVYVGSKGKPDSVNLTGYWSYDVATRIVTLTVDHASLVEVTINWILGDVNGDGVVDASDLSVLSKSYGSKFGDPDWNSDCDFNIDSKVDVSDLFILSKNYGKTV